MDEGELTTDTSAGDISPNSFSYHSILPKHP